MPESGKGLEFGSFDASSSTDELMDQNPVSRRELIEVSTPTTSGAEGYWSTKGNRIVDSKGKEVYFAGINWQGFEYVGCVVDGLQNRSLVDHLNQMVKEGFNLIRLPFAGTCIQPDVYPTDGSINFTINAGLDNKSSFDIYAEVVKEAGARGMKVILDYHRLAPPYRYDFEPGLWWNTTYNESYWLKTWKMVVSRFIDDSTVVGVDLFNEPHPEKYPFTYGETEAPYWLEDGRWEKPPLNWRTAAMRAGNMILKINPHLLICVQGMWQRAWYAGNLQDVAQYPIELKVKNKLVYSIHEYGPALRVQAWHNEADYPAKEPDRWLSNFGFIHDEEIAPIWVGEFGSLFNHTPSDINTKELVWLNLFVEYIQNKSLVWCFFTWCPNAENVGGILSQEDWLTVRQDKMDAIKSIMYPKFTFQPPIAPPPSPPFSPPYPPAGPILTLGTPGPPLAPIGGSGVNQPSPSLPSPKSSGASYWAVSSRHMISWLLFFCSFIILL